MKIAIEINVAAPIADVWLAFNNPDDIVQWDASEDWRTTWASNDLRVGGKLLLRIEFNEGGTGFDFAATYTQVEPNTLIEFRENNGQMARMEFIETGAGITIRQIFDADPLHTEDHQRADWQAVLDRFCRYVERQHGTA